MHHKRRFGGCETYLCPPAPSFAGGVRSERACARGGITLVLLEMSDASSSLESDPQLMIACASFSALAHRRAAAFSSRGLASSADPSVLADPGRRRFLPPTASIGCFVLFWSLLGPPYAVWSWLAPLSPLLLDLSVRPKGDAIRRNRARSNTVTLVN